MAQQISVKAVPREEPDLDVFVAVPVSIATERLNKEKAERASREADDVAR